MASILHKVVALYPNVILDEIDSAPAIEGKVTLEVNGSLENYHIIWIPSSSYFINFIV